MRTDWNRETDAGELDEPATLLVSLEDRWRRKRTSGGKKTQSQGEQSLDKNP